MWFDFITKVVIRGFLVIFVHLQAIERQLQMWESAEILQAEIDRLEIYRKEFDNESS